MGWPVIVSKSVKSSYRSGRVSQDPSDCSEEIDRSFLWLAGFVTLPVIAEFAHLSKWSMLLRLRCCRYLSFIDGFVGCAHLWLIGVVLCFCFSGPLWSTRNFWRCSGTGRSVSLWFWQFSHLVWLLEPKPELNSITFSLHPQVSFHSVPLTLKNSFIAGNTLSILSDKIS